VNEEEKGQNSGEESSDIESEEEDQDESPQPPEVDETDVDLMTLHSVHVSERNVEATITSDGDSLGVGVVIFCRGRNRGASYGNRGRGGARGLRALSGVARSRY
jgi:hypothetical protein